MKTELDPLCLDWATDGQGMEAHVLIQPRKDARLEV